MKHEQITSFIHKLSMSDAQEHAEIYLLQLFPGITLGINYVNTHRIKGNAEDASTMNVLRINYCFDGRCEVKLKDGRYVYVDQNAICIEDHEPQYNFHYPLGFYNGIQIFIDKDIIKKQRLETFELFGIQPQKIVNTYSDTNQTFIHNASEAFAAQSAALVAIWENDNFSYDKKLEQIRFVLCQLFFYLINEEAADNSKPYQASFLTQSQYMIAIDCEQKITKDLSQKLTIETMAATYKISPSSLKKFFTGVYGCSISEYTQTMRMKKAKELFETTDYSVMQVAALVGYENQSKFSAVFKKHTRYAPLEYKRIYTLKRNEENT